MHTHTCTDCTRTHTRSVSSAVHLMAPDGVSVSDPHLTKPGAYNYELAYGQSKLAQILFTRELRRRLRGTGVQVCVCVCAQ